MNESKLSMSLTDDEAAAIVGAFDDASEDGNVVGGGGALAELRAAAARKGAVERATQPPCAPRSEGASCGSSERSLV